MNTLKGLIFDADGTLVETEEMHRRAFNEAFAAYNLDWHWDEAKYSRMLLISGGLERMHICAAEQGESLPVPANTALGDWLKRIHKYKSRLYRRYISSRPVKPRPGIMRILREARHAGIVLAVATSSSRRNMETMLVRAGLRHFFKLVINGDDVPSKKPNSAVYLRTLAELKIPAENCIAIEDTQAGCMAATGADLAVIITTHKFTTKHDFAGAKIVANNLGEPNASCEIAASGIDCQQGYIDLEFMRKLLPQKRD